MLDPLDAILQKASPLLAVPLHGQLAPMPDYGQRILMAQNGVFVHVKRDWIEAVQKVGTIGRGFPLPYGRLEESLTLAFGTLPVSLVAQFITEARTVSPNEIAGDIVWSNNTRTLRLRIATSIVAHGERVQAKREPLEDDESIVMDIHSHGLHPADFSSQDDEDDKGFELTGVIGSLHRPVPSASFRFCINGFKAYPPLPWDSDTLPWRQLR